jgi:hypothetical protein
MSLRTWSCIPFEAGEPYCIEAEGWMTALDQAPVDCFVILHYSENEPHKRFMACAVESNVFPVAGGWWADSADKAASAIRDHYRKILEWQARREVAHEA